eukprot:Nitzschia sp. Nitz4//scaffold278_size24532//27//500//NITZ4_008369-RA/size24532-processed-gene-0.0-mRNA-1//1//CDS//3329545357//5856//frame0
MSTDSKTYQKDIVNRLGGADQYDMVIMNLAERILEDRRVGRFYKSLGFKDLCGLQREVLDLALLDMDEESLLKMETRVQLYHYRFFLLGMKTAHFDTIKDHLFESLLNCWAEPEVAEDVLECFEDLRYTVFQSCSGLSQATSEIPPEIDCIVAAFAA